MSGQTPAWARAFVAFTLRRGRLLWMIAILIAVPATLRTASLYARLKTDIEELLPRESASVQAIDELRARVSGIQHLGVVVDVGDSEKLGRGEAMLDDLAERIRKYPPALVHSVRLGPDEERKFLEHNAPLYVDLPDLKEIRARIEARRDYEVGKATDMLLEDEGPPSLDLGDIQKKYDDRTADQDRFPNGRFSSAKERATLLLIEVGDFTTGGSAAELLHRVQADVRALGGPDHYAPGMRVGYTGDVAISVEETEALMDDLSISSVIVMVAVASVIILYYRWIWSIAALMGPLLLATVVTFALSSLPPIGVTELNSNTAFLGSIIVGNGINFGIVFLARYVEERRRGAGVEDALVIAVAGSRAGTLMASLAACVAYTSLCLTEFRGFRQFGFIGGIGMVVCWVSAFVLGPSLLARIDRGKRALSPNKPAPPVVMGRLASFITSHSTAIAVTAVLLTIAAIAKVRTFGPEQMEYNLSHLRRADTWTSGEGYWGRKMDEVLGSYLTPTVILADDPEEARRIAIAVKEAAKKPPLDRMIASVRTLEDVLPSDQAAKLVEISAIRTDMTPRMRQLVPDDKKKAVDKMIAQSPLQTLSVGDLPETFTLGMRERDGAVGRTVLVYPRPSKDLWIGPTIIAFVDGLRKATNETATNGGRAGRIAGSLPLSADIFRSLGRDGPLATALAFGGVALLVLAVFRASWVGFAIVGSLFTGVLWLAALAMALGVRLNFTNFIAYPITFGIGVDYSVNVMARYVQEGGRDVARAIRSTGGAVVLCSLTTMLGYSSLLIAQNRALYLFGLLAVLGEIACLTTAVVVLPAALRVLRRA